MVSRYPDVSQWELLQEQLCFCDFNWAPCKRITAPPARLAHHARPDAGERKQNRQRCRRVMTLAASALLGLTKHSLRAADKSTIVDSGAASPEIGMTYFIMSLTSHGKTLHPSKNTIFYACYLGERWESRGSANKISGTAAFIMDSCSCIMYRVKKQLVP